MKTLYVTDFDDTLVKTDANVYVTKATGDKVTMSPEEYAVYDVQPGDTFDFSEFEHLKNPSPITRFTELLKRVIEEKKADKVAVLTARGHTKPVAKYLQSVGITSGVSIAALGDADPQRKANYIEKHINDGYTRVLFIDDSPKNIAAVKGLSKKYPHAKLIAHQVQPHQQKSKSKTQELPKSPNHYKPGETWKTDGGSFGGKNKAGQYKYFNSQEKAKQFANT
jgi:hypothetical protein